MLKELKDLHGLYQPTYKQNIFSVIPTAIKILGIETGKPTLSSKTVKRSFEEASCFDVEKVVCVLVDSFSVRQLSLFEKLEKVWGKLGELTLSSVFPTVTSSAIVSVHSGLPPERHGIVGHKIWFQQLGTIVDTLKMASVKAPSTDRLVKSGIDARVLLLEDGLYGSLNNTDVLHVELMPSSIARTGLSHVLGVEDVTVEFENPVDAFSTLHSILEKYAERKALINVYFDLTDVISHKYGPTSEEYRLAARHIEEVFTHFLGHLKKDDEVAFFFFSDHGQEEVVEDKTVKISEEEAGPLLQHLRMPPGRSGRVVHFYVKEGGEDGVVKWIEEKVGEKGFLVDFERACKFFNLKPKSRFKKEVKSRMGDYILVMNAGAELKFQKKEEKVKIIEEKWMGSHGSATLNELLVPLIAARADVFKELLGLKK
ncbi:MAG: alkaline phosphatase family protein [Candidatus Jordarchaeales archaeon]